MKIIAGKNKVEVFYSPNDIDAEVITPPKSELYVRKDSEWFGSMMPVLTIGISECDDECVVKISTKKHDIGNIVTISENHCGTINIGKISDELPEFDGSQKIEISYTAEE